MVLEIIFNDLVKSFKLDGDKLFRLLKNGIWKEVVIKVNCGTGYCQISWNGKRFYAHRLLFCLYHKCDVDCNLVIDHKNGNRIDNSKENIRLTTNRDNQGNQESHREGRFVGCCFDNRRRKWHARITFEGKEIHLGYFLTEEKTHEAYLRAKAELIDGHKPSPS